MKLLFKNCFNFFYSKKGFIGPIGDDLPSLIPIVVALLLFFTIFSITFSTYNSKNLLIEKQMNMTSVAREIKGDSLLLNVDDFQTRCSNIMIKKFPYNFMVGVYFSQNSLSESIGDFLKIAPNEVDAKISLDSSDPNSTNFVHAEGVTGGLYEGTQINYACKYMRVGALPFNPEKAGTYMLRYYPVAIQYPITDALGNVQRIIVPGIMAMVVWE